MTARRRALARAFLACAVMAVHGAEPAAAEPAQAGPWNARVLEGGVGIERALDPADPLIAANAPVTLSAWVCADRIVPGRVVLVALGEPAAMHALALVDGHPALIIGQTPALVARAMLQAGQWHHLAIALIGGTAHLRVDGVAVAQTTVAPPAVAARIAIAPVIPGWPHFGGTLVAARAEAGPGQPVLRPDFASVHVEQVGQGWEFQKTANTGYWRPQDAWTLPQARGGSGLTPPVARPEPSQAPLVAIAPDRWKLQGWRLAAAPDIAADGSMLSQPGDVAGLWRAATVPGTVLTTLVDRGVYPDPYVALNNMAIPESLARQDYWYRTQFTVPPEAAGKRLSLVLNGVNYAAQVFVNGQDLGGMRGAFTRGRFDFVPRAGLNAVAIRVAPPPHPGTPHEQSISAGVGENGGQLAIDGPTFVATEGWDWIPGIRDRDTGLWQGVELQASGAVRLGDPQIVTDLPLPRIDSADIRVTVPVINPGPSLRTVTVAIAFDDVRAQQQVTVAPGETTVSFTPAQFPALHVLHPRLWWPNGYGEPALHTMAITASLDGAVVDQAQTRFGIREVSYDLSLMDHAGRLRRVNVQPTDGALAGHKLIDVRHEAIVQTPRGWVESLTAAGESSPAVRDLGPADTLPEPHLTLRINGVKIAARGGSWGMDDAMKRHDRARLEPYFRLHRDAHLNIIRNWMGTNTEPEFYDLADEYGLMVLNDFWQSTQNFQIEPDNPQLFLANAEDVVKRYRNHPSIVVWFGRNEGVPYPTLNEGLDDLLFRLDGTRWYTGSSNMVNLQGSGPYNYRAPLGYFTDLATGFSVETGTPSLATPDAIAAYVPEADRWPLSDTLAYHDWHFSGNGDTKTFMDTLARRFGPATSFADFERKAQMLNLEGHKAMFEGFLAHLWTKNSGRLLWMTHPAWTSNAWQIYSSDYDTHAAYYGVASATEPLHVMLDQPGNAVIVVNTTQADARGLTAQTRITDLTGTTLFERRDRVDALANRDTVLPAVPLDTLLAAHRLVLIEQVLRDATGAEKSRNVYWRSRDEAATRALGDLPAVPLQLSARTPHDEVGDGVRGGAGAGAGERVLVVTVANPGPTPALAARVTLRDAAGARILPAYYSENYLSLLPGQSRTITIRFPATAGTPAALTLTGWNVTESRTELSR